MPNLTPFLARSLAAGAPPVVWVIAEFDCEGEAADELSFRAGDQIQLKRCGRRVVAQSCDGVHQPYEILIGFMGEAGPGDYVGAFDWVV